MLKQAERGLPHGCGRAPRSVKNSAIHVALKIVLRAATRNEAIEKKTCVPWFMVEQFTTVKFLALSFRASSAQRRSLVIVALITSREDGETRWFAAVHLRRECYRRATMRRRLTRHQGLAGRAHARRMREIQNGWGSSSIAGCSPYLWSWTSIYRGASTLRMVSTIRARRRAARRCSRRSRRWSRVWRAPPLANARRAPPNMSRRKQRRMFRMRSGRRRRRRGRRRDGRSSAPARKQTDTLRLR